MKTRLMLLIAATVLLVLVLFGVVMVVQKPRTDNLLYGTFMNRSISPDIFPQKAVRFPGGFKNYALVSDTIPNEQGSEKIVERWTDSGGSSWYKVQATMSNGYKFLALFKVSKSGTQLELVSKQVLDFASKNFPTKIDPTAAMYRIWYREVK
ncbi:MAG: hypothetical protein ABSG38_14135 [Spirochaetia bacterium]